MTKGERNIFTVLAHDFAFVRRIPDDLLATCRAWRKESFLCEVVCRIRDDELGNFSEVLASYSGSREQDVLSKFAAEPRPDIRGEALGDGPIDALGAIVYRLETNERRKRVPTETTPEAGKVYKDILKEGNASDVDHSRPNVE